MDNITPILLAGGSGTRLWPTSRKAYPKQFTKLMSNETLFQQSVLRFVDSDSVNFKRHITITNSNFRFIVSEQLKKIGLDPGLILIEPQAKNTAPAIIAGTMMALKDNNDAIIISAPCDHIIPDTEYFNDAIINGIEAVKNGKIVTFAISPTRPEIGYGYLKLEKNEKSYPKKVLRFVEKPNEIVAKKMLREGNYFWNSGIFMFSAKSMINAFQLYANEILSLVSKSLELSEVDLGFRRLNPKFWDRLDNISIDYAIMEKAKNIVAIPYYSSWSDLGNWDSLWRESKLNNKGVALSDNAGAIDCENTLLRSEDKNQQIFGLGLKDIVAIAMPDAVLVANRNKTQDVKKVVEYLKSKNISQSEVYPKSYRPWGWFESLALGEGFQVKKIFVKPKESLSLQSHKYRSEHWVIVEGVAKVTIDEDVKLAKEGQSFFVPIGSVHRLENPAKLPLMIIEIQVGTYLGEDDIIRYADNYSRK